MFERRNEEPPMEIAVFVRDACKAYGWKGEKQIVFRNLNMTVPKGYIYGLLGASGCGKTTLLNCIVGRRRLNSGEVWVLGGRPGSKSSGVPGPRIGYMPQEIGLYGEFTIRETFLFFGWITRMTTKDIEKKTEFLQNLLQLPPCEMYVKNLSGGQQRRVSLAVSFLHDPELLILDEPTVGLDPILRERIWDFFMKQTIGGKTIIITTHYIDETKQATTIGMIREGRLLAEQSPDDLLKNLRTDSLENAFLKLSIIDDERKEIKDVTCQKQLFKKKDIKESIKKFSFKEYLYFYEQPHLKALIWKNTLWMWRNLWLMIPLFCLPPLESVIFSLWVGTNPVGLNVAVFNREYPGQALCPFNQSCVREGLSCRYLHHLSNKKQNIVAYKDRASGENAIRTGNAWAFLEFPSNFSETLVERFERGKYADDMLFKESEINATLDMSSYQISLLFKKYLIDSLRDFEYDMAKACDFPSRAVSFPVSFQSPIYGPEEANFRNFAAPGFMLTIAFVISVTLTTGAMLFEKSEGIFERCLVSGITGIEILCSHIITQLVVMMIESVVIIIFTIFIFGIPNEGNFFTIYVLIILSGISGICYGLILSCICDRERTALYGAIGTFFPLLQICGIAWPVQGMHQILRTVSPFLPLTQTTEALRSVMARGWGLDRPTVYMGFISIIAWIVFLMLMSIFTIKLKKS